MFILVISVADQIEQLRSRASELDEERSFHREVEIVVSVVIEDKSLVNVSPLGFLIYVNHTVKVLDHKYVILLKILLELVFALQIVTSVEVNVA